MILSEGSEPKQKANLEMILSAPVKRAQRHRERKVGEMETTCGKLCLTLGGQRGAPPAVIVVFGANVT